MLLRLDCYCEHLAPYWLIFTLVGGLRIDLIVPKYWYYFVIIE